MAGKKNPIDEMIKQAEKMPDVIKGSSCTQTSFKVKKKAFLYVGPGPKGVGYKAMFKLNKSKQQAIELSKKSPDNFEIGATGWITTRFTAEKPLTKSVWVKWLKESYEVACGKK